MITRDEEPNLPQRPKLVISDDTINETAERPEPVNVTTEGEVAWSDDEADDPADGNGREVVAGEVSPTDHEADSDQPVEESEDASDATEAEKKSEQSNRTRKRPTVPSWDEIIFGTRKDK